MLVFTRRIGEQIVIDGHILVTVVGVKGEQVRLGVTAPPSVRIDRREIHERRMAENADLCHSAVNGTCHTTSSGP